MTTSIANLRLDHVPVLDGSQNYQVWEREMRITLRGENLWKYVTDGTDPRNRTEYGAVAPTLSDSPTDEEVSDLDKFLLASDRAAAIIHRKLSSTVAMRIPRSIDMDPRAMWGFLRTQFDQLDVNAQFALLGHLEKVRLKDASDAERYLAEFNDGIEKLSFTGMVLDEKQQIYLLMKGLPEAGSWGVFRQTLQHYMSETANSSRPLTYSAVITRIQAEARRLGGYVTSNRAGPGSEYANVSRESREANIHKKNPQGVACSVCG